MAIITSQNNYIGVVDLGIYINKDNITTVVRSTNTESLGIVTQDGYITILNLVDFEYTTLDEMLVSLSDYLVDISTVVYTSELTNWEIYNKGGGSSTGTGTTSGDFVSNVQSDWEQTDSTQPDYILNKQIYQYGKEFTLSDTYTKGNLGWQLSVGDNLENAFGKVAYALDRLLVGEEGFIIVIIEDDGVRKDGTIVITDPDGVEVSSTVTVDGTLTAELPYAKYTVELQLPGYDILSTSTILDNLEEDNALINSTALNVDVAGFNSIVTFKVAPTYAPSLSDIVINEGAATSSNSNLRIALTTVGIVDEVMFAQDLAFTGAVWTSCPDPLNIDYVFTYVDEITLTLYAKVRNSTGESIIKTGSIYMQNGVSRSDSTSTYNSLNTALKAVVEDYPDGLTQDVEITLVSEVYESAISKWLTEVEYFNQGTMFTLTINGNKLLTVDCVTNGGIRLDFCDNIIFSGVNFINVGSMKDHGWPEQLSAFFLNYCNNIVVDNCYIDGRYLTDTSYLGWYCIIVKYNNNFTLSNTEIAYFAALVLTIKDVNAVTIKNCYVHDCTVQVGITSQPALFELANIEYLVVQDCDIDGTGMDTCFSGNNITRSLFDRTEMHDCPGEIIAFTNTKHCESFTMNSCLVHDNLYNPYYYWTKQVMSLQTLDTVTFTNNTIRLEAVDGNNYYASFCKSYNGTIGELNLYNNIFDIYMPTFTNNSSQSRLFQILVLDSFNEDYNLYRDYTLDGDEFNNYILTITDSSSTVYNNGVNSMTELRALGVGVHSTLINVSDALFIDSDYYQLDPTIVALEQEPSHLSMYDIDKNLAVTPNIGCKYMESVADEATTVIKYIGQNLDTNELFTQDDSEHVVYSNSLVLLSVDKYDDNQIYKWVFTSYLDVDTMYIGTNVGIHLLSDLDEDGLYTGDSVYSLEITNL